MSHSPSIANNSQHGGLGMNTRTMPSSPTPLSQHQQTNIILTTPQSNSNRNSRNENSAANKPDSGQKSHPSLNAVIPSPSNIVRTFSHHSPSDGKILPHHPKQDIHFDPDLSSNLSISHPPTEAQMEAYLTHLAKLFQSTSLKDRNGKTNRRRHIEEMMKVLRVCEFEDLRIVNDIFASLLRPQEDRTLLDEHHAALDLLCTCLETQPNSNSYRPFFFQLLTNHKQQLPARLLGLFLLTKNGRDCAPITTFLAGALIDWMSELEGIGAHIHTGTATPSNNSQGQSSLPALQLPPNADSPVIQFLQICPTDPLVIVHRAVTQKLLLLILRFVKYHYGQMGERNLAGLIGRMCDKASHETDAVVQSYILPFIDIVIRSGVPSTVRPRLIHALCLCVNISSRDAWSCFRLQLESRDGMEIVHQLLDSMDEMSDDFLSSAAPTNGSMHSPSTETAVPIRALRGGIFLVAMSAWASQRVASLHYPFAVILRHFDHVMDCGHILLVYEIVLACRRLVKKFGPSLKLEWDPLLAIFHKSFPFAVSHSNSNLTDILSEVMADLIDQHVNGKLTVSDDDILPLLITFKPLLTTAASIQLLTHFSTTLHPSSLTFFDDVHELIQRFFTDERDTSVRLHAMDILEHLLWSHRAVFGDRIIHECVIGSLMRANTTTAAAAAEEDLSLRQRKLLLLTRILNEIPTTHSKEILRIVELSVTQSESREMSLFSTRLLITVLQSAFGQLDPTLALATFDTLLRLTSHSDLNVRLEVVDALLKLRSSEDGRLEFDLAPNPHSAPTRLVAHFMLAPSSVMTLSQALVQMAIRRLRSETARELVDRCMAGLHALIDNFYLFDAAPGNSSLLIGFACDWCRHMSEERRHLLATNHESRRRVTSPTPIATNEMWVHHWNSPPLVLSLWQAVRATLTISCRTTPALVEEVMNCILTEFDEFARAHLHASSGGAWLSMESHRQLQTYLDCVHVIMLSNSQQLHNRYIGHLIDRLIKLAHSATSTSASNASSSSQRDHSPWIVSLLQLAHSCASLSYLHSTLDHIHQICALTLPLLSSPSPSTSLNPTLTHLASRVLSSWFVTLTLAERQSILPTIHNALHKQAPKSQQQQQQPQPQQSQPPPQQSLSKPVVCLLDFVNRHAYWSVTPSTLHQTQVIPSKNSSNSALFPSNSLERTWLQDLTLFSIRVGLLDYVEIVIRRSSGTASWLLRFTKPSIHFSAMPSLLPQNHWKLSQSLPISSTEAPPTLIASHAAAAGTTASTGTSKARKATPLQTILISPSDADLSSPSTPASSGRSSKHPSAFGSYSSPARYIPPGASPSSPAIAQQFHAWPRMAPKPIQTNISSMAPSNLSATSASTRTALKKDEAVIDSHAVNSYKERHADALLIASSLMDFELDASPKSTIESISDRLTGDSTSTSAYINVQPLLSYDATTTNEHDAAPETSPRLYPISAPLQSETAVESSPTSTTATAISTPKASPASEGAASTATTVASTATVPEMSSSPPRSARSAGPSNELLVPIHPIPRRLSGVSTLGGAILAPFPLTIGDTGIAVSPFRGTPRSSSESSPIPNSGASSTMTMSPSPPLAIGTFTHATSSPFRAASKVINTGAHTPSAAASKSATDDKSSTKDHSTTTNTTAPSSSSNASTQPMSSLPPFQRLSSKDSPKVSSPSTRRVRGDKRQKNPSSDHSPIVPLRSRKHAGGPASSSLSLLTQAFSNQKLKSSPTHSLTPHTPSESPSAIASTFLAAHGLPLSTTTTTGGVTSAQLEKMWTLIQQLEKEKEEDERKSKSDTDHNKTLAPLTAAPAAVNKSPLDPSLHSDFPWQPEYIMTMLSDNFPDFHSDPSVPPSSSTWQNLSSFDEDTLAVALTVLDSTPIRDTLKVGVLYVGPGQSSEAAILQNTRGSTMYQRFLQTLGDTVALQGEMRYTGGMDREGNRDGEVAIIYCDMMTEVKQNKSTRREYARNRCG